MKSNESRHLYFIQCEVTGIIKIGRSDNPERRFRNIQSYSPTKLILRLVLANKGYIEHYLHDVFKEHHAHDEWFHPSKELEDFISSHRELHAIYQPLE